MATPIGGIDAPKGDEQRLSEAHTEAEQQKENLIKEFKESQDGKKLQALLGDSGKSVFERIATLYATKLGKKGLNDDVDKSILLSSVNEFLQSKEHQKQTGIVLDESSKEKLFTLVKSEFEQENPAEKKQKEEGKEGTDTTSFGKLEKVKKVPEFDIVERLAKQGHLTPEQLETFKKENNNASQEQIKQNIITLVNGIKDEKVKTKVLDSISGKDEIEKAEGAPVTPKDIKETDFYADWGKKIDEDRNISDFELRIATNYISIPKAGEKNAEQATEKEKIDNLSMTISKVGKQVVTEQNQAFRETHANDISIILNPEEKIETRYKKLEELFNEGEKLKNLAKAGQEGRSGKEQKGEKAKQIQELIAAGQKKAASEVSGQKKLDFSAIEEAEKRNITVGDIQSLQGGKIDTMGGNDTIKRA